MLTNLCSKKQFFRVMRITTFLILLGLLQVSANSSAQLISLSGNNMPLMDVLKEIRLQSGYDFIFAASALENAHTVSLDIHDLPLEEALRRVFADQPLAYEMEEKAVTVWVKASPRILRSNGISSDEERRRETLSSLVLAYETVKGRIVDSLGNPLVGASVRVLNAEGKRTSLQTKTDHDGYFELRNVPEDARLEITYIGYVQQVLNAEAEMASVVMKVVESELEEVEVIVNTGYQQLPKERATGSFAHINNDILNRSVSTDIISRIADVVPGLIFNRQVSANPNAQTNISIRGQSTLFARADPLIVIDNFPYEGNINNINPNDVLSISVLKDAAAASIWGARAGNGVIVITTKKGENNASPKISSTSNLTIGQRPDLFYVPIMSSSDYIEIEKRLFNQKYYTALETSINKEPLSPIIELLILSRDNVITEAEANDKIEMLKQLDVRRDISEYLYRTSVDQQHAINIAGGGPNQHYFVSGGYDKNLNNAVGSSYERITLNANNTYSLFNKSMELSTSVIFNGSKQGNNEIGSSELQMSPGKLLPYTQLANETGQGLPITYRYRNSFIRAAEQQGLLHWDFIPLEEQKQRNAKIASTDYRINVNLKQRVTQNLMANILYQYGNTMTENRILNSLEVWSTRDMINKFTIVNANGSLTRPVPLGGIMSLSRASTHVNYLRSQLNYDKDWKKYTISGLAGAEIRDVVTVGDGVRRYGYDENLAVFQNVDHFSTFVSYVNPQSRFNRIQNSSSNINYLTDRFVSYYVNGAYSYGQKYTFSGSARLDQSNLFGVKTNQKGVPLWSVGMSWNIDKENFYHVDWLPYLKLRSTFGYNGNVDKRLSAQTTVRYSSAAATILLPYATLINAPNPQLRWEKVSMFNLGLEFKLAKNWLNGSIEYYQKQGMDLIGDAPFAPQTGITAFRGNIANTKGKGLDIQLNSLIMNGKFSWRTHYLFSYVEDKVTKYLLKSTNIVSNYLVGSTMPTEGKPLYGLYSYPSAGLDPQNGNPRGYLNGNISSDYAAIKSTATIDNLKYHGAARPTVYGAVRNDWDYKGFSVSANISYRFGYFLRAPSVSYGSVLSGNGGHGDFSLRWRVAGDEAKTHVPSEPNQPDANRDQFYELSDVLVRKGDHFRLQDLRVAYWFRKQPGGKLSLCDVQLYLYASNLGVLWKANPDDVDPDYLNTAPTARKITMGLTLNF